VLKISPSPGFDPRTFQPVASRHPRSLIQDVLDLNLDPESNYPDLHSLWDLFFVRPHKFRDNTSDFTMTICTHEQCNSVFIKNRVIRYHTVWSADSVVRKSKINIVRRIVTANNR
jgi:hypothetical protein